MDLQHNSILARDDDEISLGDLGRILWAGRFKALAAVLCCTLLAGLYLGMATSRYQAVSIFALNSEKPGSSLASQYAGLAALAGVDLGGGDETKGVFDRLAGEDFIRAVITDAGLEQDPFFNPSLRDKGGFGLAGVLRLFGVARNSEPADPLMDLVAAYRAAVRVDETRNGSITVSVGHTDPVRAADLANRIVNRLVEDLTTDRVDRQQKQLSYLTVQMADALQQMESSKRAVADFALANSLTSPQQFAARSQAMFNLREELGRIREMETAVEELRLVLETSTSPSAGDYEFLRKRAPIVDDVEFRRLIGVPEALGAWTWPTRARLDDFSATLKDRIVRIERLVNDLTVEAERYAASSEELAGLEREAQVAEATYSVLTEQMKAKALAAGFQNQTAVIYQTAVPPTQVASPRSALVLGIAIFAGLVLGLAWSAVALFRKGAVLSAEGLGEEAGAGQVLKHAGFLRGGPGEPAARIAERLAKLSGAQMSPLVAAQAQHGGPVALVAATAPGVPALPLALWMAQRARSQGKGVVVLSLSPRAAAAAGGTVGAAGLFASDLGGVGLLEPRDMAQAEAALMAQAGEPAPLAGDRHDLVIFAVPQELAEAAAVILGRNRPFVVLLAKVGQTKKSVLQAIMRRCKVDAIVSDQ